MWSHHYSRTEDGSYRRNSVPFRYAWPAEFDLMARLAGHAAARAVGVVGPDAVHRGQ